jgi:hypothetical protein
MQASLDTNTEMLLRYQYYMRCRYLLRFSDMRVVCVYILQNVYEVDTQRGDYMVFQVISAYFSLIRWFFCPLEHWPPCDTRLLFSIFSPFLLHFSSRKSLSTSFSHISMGLQNFLTPSGLLSEMAYIIRHYFFQIHFNIIQKSVCRSSMWLLRLWFPNENSA